MDLLKNADSWNFLVDLTVVFSDYIHELYQNSVFRLTSLIFLDFHQGWATHNRIGVNCFFRNLFSFSLQSFAIYLCNRAKKSNYFFPVDFFSLFTFSVCDHFRDLQRYKFQNFLNQQKTLINNQSNIFFLILPNIVKHQWQLWSQQKLFPKLFLIL